MKTKNVQIGFLVSAVCGLMSGAFAAPPDSEAVRFYQKQIQPILVDNCYQCHSHQADKIRGNFVLDSSAGLLKGGVSGPAIIPGDSEKSLLIQAIRYDDPNFQMPPKGKKLTETEINLLVQWVEMGAPWPAESDPVFAPRSKITDEDRAWWAFQPVRKPDVPEIEGNGWARNEIDHFILQKLAEEGLAPADEADKRTLIRRAYLSVTGLPPSPAEISAFVRDDSPEAYSKLIDQLLDSPRYGERWARHWLDLVRYAESDGYRQDAFRPSAWRYRDYVIRALNEDKPFDRFLAEQLAGDELAPHDPDVLVATGFLRLWIYEFNQRDVRGQWDSILNDITDVTSDVFLGLGMRCARCHDHKFDPLLQKDYYRLQAFFTPILPRDDIPLATASQWLEYQNELAKWEAMTKEIREQIEQIERPHREAQGDTTFVKFPPDIKEMILTEPANRNPFEHQLAELAYRQLLFEFGRFEGRIRGEEKERWEGLRKELAQFDRYKPEPLPEALLATDVGPFAPPTFIPQDRSKTPVKPGFPTIFTEEPAKIAPIPTAPNSTGRRTALARWMTEPDNPLTSRVMVNRLWHYHFGRGIVSTPSDFGLLGERPSHPELLDWLASEFVERNWRLKEIHRLILTSAAFRQTSLRSTPELAAVKDPDNHWLWRMNPRRMDGEQIRDAMLSVSGELDLNAGGPSVQPSQPRRAIYTRIFRNQADALLEAFDPPDPYNSIAQRNVTTTPTQSLFLINGPWVLERAKAAADLLQKELFPTDEKLVEQAFQRILGRRPDSLEREQALAFFQAQIARVTPTVSSGALTASMPGRSGQAALFDGTHPGYHLPSKPTLPAYDFTIESFVELHSTPTEERTIAARWDGSKNQPGWALSVDQERRILLHLVGVPDEEGEGGYEQIVSTLKLPLDQPCYVAVTVRIADSTETGVTFYLKELNQPETPMRIQGVPHTVTAHHYSVLPFSIGARDNDESHLWHGLIGEIRLSETALRRDQLLIERNGALPATFGYWRFEENPGFLKDSSGQGHDLTSDLIPVLADSDARSSALTDLCHVLLNSNEFLYVE